MRTCICTWNPNDLYFWRSTPQNKAFSNQNKGHLGSRYTQNASNPSMTYSQLLQWPCESSNIANRKPRGLRTRIVLLVDAKAQAHTRILLKLRKIFAYLRTWKLALHICLFSFDLNVFTIRVEKMKQMRVKSMRPGWPDIFYLYVGVSKNRGGPPKSSICS